MSSRSLDLLEQDFRFKVQLFLLDPRIKELSVAISCTGRTQEEQDALYEQWRTTKWKVVTWTRNSEHLIPSTAIDIFCSDPKLWLYPKDPAWWSEIYSIARFFWIKSLYETYNTDRPHLSNNRKRPPQVYINLNKNMKDISKAQLEAMIALNSSSWHLTDDQKLQDQLSKMNDYLRWLLN